MGIKQSEEFLSVPFKLSTQHIPSGTPAVVIDGVDLTTIKQWRSGNELPNHKAIILSKGNATTALSGYTETCKFNKGTISTVERGWNGATNTYYDIWKYSSTRNSLHFASVPPPSPSGTSVTRAQSEAQTKFFERVRSLERSVTGQVLMGELRETIQMLKSPFRSGISLLTSMMRTKTFRSPVRATSELWLQYRFGILPLIQDCEDIMKIIDKKTEVDRIGQYRTYGEAYDEETTSYTSGGDAYGSTINGTITTKQRAQCIIRFGYRHVAKGAHSGRIDDLQESFLNPRDLPSTAWELIPWSFLIDYFLNVGALLNAVTTSTSGVVYTSTSTIVTTSMRRTVDAAKSVNDDRYRIDSFSPGFIERTKRQVDRTSTPVGFPTLTFELPGSNVRLANIAALLGSLLKGK